MEADGFDLDAATRAELDRFFDRDGETRVRFRNGLLRDVTYEGDGRIAAASASTPSPPRRSNASPTTATATPTCWPTTSGRRAMRRAPGSTPDGPPNGRVTRTPTRPPPSQLERALDAARRLPDGHPRRAVRDCGCSSANCATAPVCSPVRSMPTTGPHRCSSGDPTAPCRAAPAPPGPHPRTGRVVLGGPARRQPGAARSSTASGDPDGGAGARRGARVRGAAATAAGARPRSPPPRRAGDGGEPGRRRSVGAGPGEQRDLVGGDDAGACRRRRLGAAFAGPVRGRRRPRRSGRPGEQPRHPGVLRGPLERHPRSVPAFPRRLRPRRQRHRRRGHRRQHR